MTSSWMPLGLPVHGYAIAAEGPSADRVVGGLPADALVLVPDPKPHARRARLPSVGEALAKAALRGGVPSADASVLIGTAYGCLTETAVFVENLVAQDGAAPAPRAFTNSVHNAIASSIARGLGARGECHTFVQGAVAFGHALLAATLRHREAPSSTIVIGGVDEWTDYVARGLASCDAGAPAVRSEGGAVLCCAGASSRAPLASIGALALPGRVAARDVSPPPGVDAVFADRGIAEASDAVHRIDLVAACGGHPARGAIATAIAIGLVAGEIAPGHHGLVSRPARIAVIVATRFGDIAGWTVESLR